MEIIDALTQKEIIRDRQYTGTVEIKDAIDALEQLRVKTQEECNEKIRSTINYKRLRGEHE